MHSLYTIGCQGKSLEQFIRSLRGAGVDAVIDVRLRNTSQLAGYTKRDDLAFLLREGFAIAYEHHPELAPDEELLDWWRAGGVWDDYVARFLPLLRDRHAEEVGRLVTSRYEAPCLLCMEAKPEHCHRRLVAEYWVAHLSDLRLVHL
ncbi:MAG: DUF488 domain-containing protein [Anaerolineae bacterium]